MGNYNLKINGFINTQSAVSVAVFLNPTYIYGRTALTLNTRSLWRPAYCAAQQISILFSTTRSMKGAGSDFIEHRLIQKYKSESCNAHCSSTFTYI